MTAWNAFYEFLRTLTFALWITTAGEFHMGWPGKWYRWTLGEGAFLIRM